MDTPIHRADANRTRSAGIFFFVLAAQFMTVIMLAASIAPGYDYAGGAISDLGVVAQTNLLFNVSLLIVGILNVAGGWLLFGAHQRLWLLAMYLVAGIGAIGAALFPLDSGDLHALFAIVAFIFFSIEALATTAIVRGLMRWVSVVAGVVGLLFVVIMVIGDSGNAQIFGAIGHGGAERMIVYPVMLWLLGLGGYLMAGGEAS